MMRLFWPSLALMALLAGCVNLAPDYQRPEAPVSEQWLPAAPNPSASASVPTDIEWQNFFTDNRLVRLQTLALINNRDLRLASLNVEKAQAQYRIERAASLPTIDASGSATHTRTSASTSTTGRSSINHEYSAQLGLSSYELDVFGRIQNLQDEALEDYLALTETRRSTQISLIAEVATGWLTLAADNQLLKLAEDTLASQRQSYDLTSAATRWAARRGWKWLRHRPQWNRRGAMWRSIKARCFRTAMPCACWWAVTFLTHCYRLPMRNPLPSWCKCQTSCPPACCNVARMY